MTNVKFNGVTPGDTARSYLISLLKIYLSVPRKTRFWKASEFSLAG